MRLLEWKPEYAIGIASVDYEHRRLIALINALYAELDDTADHPTIEGFLGDIHAEIAAHFALEERHMREMRYDEYLEHKADHERLLDEILSMMDEFADRPDTAVERLRIRMADWFGLHFQTYDARLHRAIAC